MKKLSIYYVILIFILPSVFRPFYNPETNPFIELILGVASLFALIELIRRIVNYIKRKNKK